MGGLAWLEVAISTSLATGNPKLSIANIGSQPPHIMKLSTLSCSLLACISPLVSATALTYKLSANERACFYSWVENKGAKIAFYFAVSGHSSLLMLVTGCS